MVVNISALGLQLVLLNEYGVHHNLELLSGGGGQCFQEDGSNPC